MTDGTTNLETRVAELEQRVDELERLIQEGKIDEEVTRMEDLVHEVDPSTHAERALVIGYYLERHQGRENFTRADIEEGYRTCRLPKPANMSDVLSSLESKEWATPDGKDGQSKLRRLTRAGINKIQEELEYDA
jgi:hypothetical protein